MEGFTGFTRAAAAEHTHVATSRTSVRLHSYLPGSSHREYQTATIADGELHVANIFYLCDRYHVAFSAFRHFLVLNLILFSFFVPQQHRSCNYDITFQFAIDSVHCPPFHSLSNRPSQGSNHLFIVCLRGVVL